MSFNFKWYPLEELATIKYGKNQKKVQDNENGKYPIYGTGGLMGYANDYLYNKPSVLIGRKGSISKVKYVEHSFWTVDTLFYTQIKEDKVIPKYLYYNMSLTDFNFYNEGTTIPSLRTDTLNKIEFLIPPIEEQKAIAKILSDLDNKIEVNNKINKRLEDMAQSIFKHWFVDFEFPNGEGKSYKSSGGEMVESELGMIPKGWEVKNISDICEIGSSKRIFMKEYVDSGIPFYRGKEIIQKSNGNTINTELFISKERYREIKEKFGAPIKNDILLTSVGTIGVAYLVGNEEFYFKDGNLTWFKNFIQDVYRYYIYQFLISDEGKKELDSITIGSTQKALTINSLNNIRIVTPSSELLNRFEKLIIPIIDSIRRNNIENERVSNLRDTLLPKLMSGEIRVPTN
ncbi:MAG: restriction endonuclease subunit S, partial [Romboutsia sp.]|uniref:restriction endonuclease subunit S n=1 Tax=Romboutsia sp. TaxID=1965302 RepID=UPI003F2B6E8E